MKKLLLIPLLAIAVTGCNTVKPNLGPLSAIASYTGASADLNKHPEHCADYLATINNLATLEATGNYTAGSYALAMQSLPVRQLNDPKASIIVGNIVLLLNFYGDSLIGTNQTDFVKPVVLGTKAGLAQAAVEHGCHP